MRKLELRLGALRRLGQETKTNATVATTVILLDLVVLATFVASNTKGV